MPSDRYEIVGGPSSKDLQKALEQNQPIVIIWTRPDNVQDECRILLNRDWTKKIDDDTWNGEGYDTGTTAGDSSVRFCLKTQSKTGWIEFGH